VLKGKADKAYEAALEMRDMFEPGCFFIELQKNGLADQDKANEELLNIAETAGIPLVATNDCHYLRREDHFAHEVLLCIQTGKKLTDEGRMHMGSDQFYMKSAEEVYEQFKGLEGAVENTERIAAMCNLEIQLDKVLLPKFPTPAGETADACLARLAAEGLSRRLAAKKAKGKRIVEEEYRQRLEYELSVISKMGFSDYYLIVQDFINRAREMGVPVGPGRGSGAGSLVAHAVGITQLDPLQFDLLFERFLNPERIDMPDFDIDFCQAKRDKVIEYVTGLYGKDRVGQIITYSQLNAKAAIKDVGRVLGFSFAEADKLTKLIPEGPAAATTALATLMEDEPALDAAANQDARHRQLFDICLALEKLNRQAGVHAAGVVISKEPLVDVVPLCTGKLGELVTQYSKEEVERVGLVKFDFLGLKTLTVMDEALRLIQLNGKEPPDLENVPLDCADVYALISSAETTGVFQMESDGFRKLLRKLRPDRFDDIIAVLALYRPGPLKGGMVDDYVRRKHGEIPISYEHDVLEPILKETYGVIVYQEQVMRIGVSVAGFSLSQADELRKVMSKKKKEKMPIMKARFMDGGEKRNFSKEFLASLFATLEVFAEYGFNKSHSAAYAFIAYWTAYLKARFRVEFMAALMSLDKDKPDKMVRYLAECRRTGVTVRGPDINKSMNDFNVVGEQILFGMAGVKNVGESAVDAIVGERAAGGPFKSFYDFCLRMDGKKVNRRVVEGLVSAGAFDCFGQPRRLLIRDLDSNLIMAQAEQRDRAVGQKSLFGMKPAAGKGRKKVSGGGDGAAAPVVCEFAMVDRETLRMEKEAIGCYLCGHPLDRYLGFIGEMTTHTLEDLERCSNGDRVVVAGVVSGLSEKSEKSGRGRMARFELEDQNGMVPAIAFSSAYEAARDMVLGTDPVVVKGSVMVEGDAEMPTIQLRVEEVSSLPAMAQSWTRRVEVCLDSGKAPLDALSVLDRVLQTHGGECPVSLRVILPGKGHVRVDLGADRRIALGEDLLQALANLVGQSGLQFVVKPPA
jgi:DNA polymerase-3 subunit alpha